MNRYLNLFAGLVLCLGTMAAPLHAQTSTRAGSPMTDDQIDARYDAAKERCDAMKGDDKDVCMERAKADKKTAEAEAKAKFGK